MPDNDNYSLRPEAGPIPYLKHHKRAKEAIKFIIRVLKAAADRVQESEGVASDASIDTNRASRICFVSGEPGSGKSTLYLTLRAMLSSKGENKYSDGCPPDIGLGKLQGVVRLLDPLDLEVVGDERENLLAAVLVRLFRELPESRSVHSNNCEDAIKELEELASDIGIAWEGNLQERAGALDPATYSEEVMHTQRARLGVNDRLRNALDKLAKNQCYGCSPETLFVLPVDDLYLKPDASLQLLRLLRMISIPRLFFLVMGDITTVEALFIEKSLKDWTAVAGTRLFAYRSDRLDEALSRARELRARYLRKLLPPVQRATIEAMDWFEALDFEIGRPGISVETLEELLEQVKLDDPLSPDAESEDEAVSLLDFLISPPFKKEQKEKRKQRAKEDVSKMESPEDRNRKKDRAAYTALQILDATPREMLDLGSALREVIIKRKRNQDLEEKCLEVGDENAPLLLSRVMDFVQLVSEEQNFFTEDEQNVLADVLPVRHYFLEDIHFNMDRLCLKPVPWPWKNAALGKLDNPNSDPGNVWIRKHRSWNLAVNRAFIEDSKDKNTKSTNHKDGDQITKPQQSPFNYLPPRPTAWIVLLHDLAWTWSTDNVTGNLIIRLKKELGSTQPAPVRGSQSNNDCMPKKESSSNFEGEDNPETKKEFDPPKDFQGWAIWRNNETDEHFPMPEFETFQKLDQFLRVWNSGFEWRDALRKQAVALQKQAKKVKKEAETDKAKEAEAAELQKQADAAKNRADEYLQDNNLLYLWGVAGSVVLNGQYESFAARKDNWFIEKLTKFKEEVTEHSKGWPKDIYDFLTRVVPPAPSPEGGSKEDRP
jgi:hypothetical protein